MITRDRVKPVKHLTIKQLRELPQSGKTAMIPHELYSGDLYDDVYMAVNDDHPEPLTGDFVYVLPKGSQVWGDPKDYKPHR